MDISIAKRFYEYRKASGLSQEQVAAKIGVSRQAVSKWECAESSPDTENLIALAGLYGVTVDELLFTDPEEEASARVRGDAYEGSPIDNDGAGPAFDNDGAGPAFDNGADRAADSGDRAWAAVFPDGDYVDISLERGVHVRDSKKGEEVHVGWDGIHVDSDKEHVHLDFARLARMIREFRKDQK